MLEENTNQPIGQVAVSVALGFEDHERATAATIYDEAFGAKFSLAIPHETHRRRFLEATFQPKFAFASKSNGRLVGLAGFQTADGSLTGGITYRSLLAKLGWFAGHRAAAIFAIYERKPRPRELLMDGIAVTQEMRGRGIGSELLEQVFCYARSNGFESVRLDVIDANPRAKRLYERHGFVATKTEEFEWLRWFFGFGAVTTMIYQTEHF